MSGMLSYLKEHTNVEVKKVLDPTLLLNQSDYDKIAYPERLEKEKYLLLYARRKNDKMTAYADRIAKKKRMESNRNKFASYECR